MFKLVDEDHCSSIDHFGVCFEGSRVLSDTACLDVRDCGTNDRIGETEAKITMRDTDEIFIVPVLSSMTTI